MRLQTVFIRFYKSFNFDYLLQVNKENENGNIHYPWDDIDGKFYPYVRIPIDPKVTTIVGANESGKTHLLSAIQKGITGQEIQHEDFCRYSDFFTVNQNEVRLPDFGYEFKCLSEYERQRVQQIAGIQPEEGTFETFFIFRTQNNLTIYLPGEKQGRQIQQNKVDFLPRIFDIKANIALPDTVPIARIIEQTQYKNKLSGRTTTLLEQWQRKHIDDTLDDIAELKIIPKTKTDTGFRTINGQPRPMSELSEYQSITNQECQLLNRLTKYLNLDDLSNERH